MCPVRSVTYVSGRSINSLTGFCAERSCTVVGQCFDLFHGILGDFGNEFDVVLLCRYDAGMTLPDGMGKRQAVYILLLRIALYNTSKLNLAGDDRTGCTNLQQ